jgi:DNA uptake protein ComE-like DNA-binding protein
MSRSLHLKSFATAVVVALAACGGADAPADDAAAPEAVTAEAPATAPMEEGGLLNPNTVSQEQLLALPGMSAELASALMAGRPFENMLGVDEVLATALDEAAREEIYGTLFLPLDVNTASEVELKLIPGVGDRMAYEFDEYRPYDGIERFRREIGKYVDEDVLARFEKYIVIR